MTTESEIEVAAKAIFLAATYHDQFAPAWDTATHMQKMFAYRYAKVALEAVEAMRVGKVS
jgi:hypothetical protein